MSASSGAARPLGHVDTVGRYVLARGQALGRVIDFLGLAVIAVVRLLTRRARPSRRAFAVAFQESGVETLPVVAAMAAASGGVLSLLAAQQMEKLGAPALAPKLIGIAILGELGALITGIAVAGRVASAFAAEIAARRASGTAAPLDIETFDALVMPRILALVLAGPLLVTYANSAAIVGGTAVAAGLLGSTVRQHFDGMMSALTIAQGTAGLVKGAVFGLVCALAGCYYGLHAETGPAGIGRAVRRAVVFAVVAVAVADVTLTFVLKWVPL
jgi:phospholipid/cholesterol/gamma-HCH transport system permease protein